MCALMILVVFMRQRQLPEGPDPYNQSFYCQKMHVQKKKLLFLSLSVEAHFKHKP